MRRGTSVRPAVDWAEVRRRIDAVGRAVAGQREVSPEQVRAELEARAKRLAQPGEPAAAGGGIDLITFVVGDERFGIEARLVHEVFRVVHRSALPGARPPLVGVTARRGELLPLVDMRAIVGGAGDAAEGLGYALAIGLARPAFGVLASAAGEVLSLAPADLLRPPEGLAAGPHVRGVTPEAVLVLDGEQLLRLGVPPGH